MALFRLPRRTPAAARPATPSVRPGLEQLEGRLVPTTVPLHVAGNQLLDSSNHAVVLRGVNIPSMEWGSVGDNLAKAESIALKDWHANLVRLSVNQDFWFGHDEACPWLPADPGGANYRAQVDQVVRTAQASNAYVMLDLHWSDAGTWGASNGQHLMPDDNSTAFWKDAAARYANNPAVLFDAYNEPTLGMSEPTDADFAIWQHGGTVPENDSDGGHFTGTYHTPGMQGLIDTIRATGARNIISAGGLDWGSDLTGVLTGHALADPTGNLMYSSHLYPDKLDNAAIEASVTAVARSHPIYVGEWGIGGVIGQPSAGAAQSNRDMLKYLDQHNYNWTAWALTPDFVDDQGVSGNWNLLTSWDASATTSDYGALVKTNLLAHATQVNTNQAPTVAVAAHASVGTVLGKTTSLSVLGADDAGEAALTYTWSVTSGPASVAFTGNGTNAGKSTTATFHQAGTYTFQATLTDAGGLKASSTVQVVVNQTFTQVAITPAAPTMTTGTRQQLKAMAQDQFGQAMARQPAFTWSATGGGSISRTGLYQAPANAANVVIKARSGTITGSTSLTVVPQVPLSVTFADVDEWGDGGFTGSITLKNQGRAAITNWVLEFDFTGNLYESWNADIISHVGNHYVLRNASWNATLAAGQSLDFGFNAYWADPATGPVNFVLNGQRLG